MALAAVLASLLAVGMPAHADDGRWYVVLGSFGSTDAAQAARAALESSTTRPLGLLSTDDGRQRLVAGPFPDRPAALAARAPLRKLVPDAWLLAVSTESQPVVATDRDTDAAPPAVIVTPDEDTTAATATAAPPAAALPLTLNTAIATSLTANPALRAGLAGLQAGQAQVRIARSGLLPQIGLALEAAQIDPDRAASSNGRAPEYLQTASANLSQVLYSEDARARLAIERIRQGAREQAQQALVLDTILDTMVAYLDVLRADALRQIRSDDLALAQSNYERAEIRLQLGVAARSEVYRWETNRARARTELANAEARMHQARFELDRLMAVQARLPRVLEPIDQNHPHLLVSEPAVQAALAQPRQLEKLRRFLLDEALSGAPDLEQLRRDRQAQERALAGARRTLVIPALTASASAIQETGRSGEGAEELDINFADFFPGAPADSQIGGNTDKLQWRLALRAELPLLQGGARHAEVSRLQHEVDRLQYQYDATLQRIRAGILSNAASAEARFANIGYARTAAAAARSNLELVRVSYERGVVTIIDLLDAQNARTQSELSATNAVYDFLADWFRLQRNTGQFDIVQGDAERSARRTRLLEALRGD